MKGENRAGSGVPTRTDGSCDRCSAKDVRLFTPARGMTAWCATPDGEMAWHVVLRVAAGFFSTYLVVQIEPGPSRAIHVVDHHEVEACDMDDSATQGALLAQIQAELDDPHACLQWLTGEWVVCAGPVGSVAEYLGTGATPGAALVAAMREVKSPT